jgi:hypothetical protein
MANLTPPVDDFLAAMLPRGEAPTLDVLFALSPDEPLKALKPCEGAAPVGSQVIEAGHGTYIVVPHKWTNRQLELRRRYPGLQLDYWYREARKYRLSPERPLSGRVSTLLDTAKMHHSRAVEAYDNGWAKCTGLSIHCTNLQFRDWLPGYIEHRDWRAAFGGEWEEAAQIVRLACGLSRFAPTKPPKTSR